MYAFCVCVWENWKEKQFPSFLHSSKLCFCPVLTCVAIRLTQGRKKIHLPGTKWLKPNCTFSEQSTYVWLFRLRDIFTLLPLETLAFDADFLLTFFVIYPDTLKLESVNDSNKKFAEYKKRKQKSILMWNDWWDGRLDMVPLHIVRHLAWD